mmetsp:Transcript_29670/g.71422  ORF Transcript_29670/g.71422 Transcript_29670/m.71422 type:complete len:102 (+) Transcript_29670:122-427(+)
MTKWLIEHQTSTPQSIFRVSLLRQFKIIFILKLILQIIVSVRTLESHITKMLYGFLVQSRLRSTTVTAAANAAANAHQQQYNHHCKTQIERVRANRMDLRL